MITDSFDAETKPLISLEAFYGERRYLIDTCLVTFSHRIFEHAAEEFKGRKIAEFTCANGPIPIMGFDIGGSEVGLFMSPIGSAAAGTLCIEANWLTGASRFIMFGSAGSLDEEKTRARFVIPTEAYRDEGLSYHYAPAADYIRIKNAAMTAGFFDELGLPHFEGRIWTTDSMLRETAGNAAKRRGEGCIAADMEVAGVQAVCDFCGFELYDFLRTGDVLYQDDYDIGELKKVNHDTEMLHIAIELAKRIRKM